jgi:signal transduction histidine kinase
MPVRVPGDEQLAEHLAARRGSVLARYERELRRQSSPLVSDEARPGTLGQAESVVDDLVTLFRGGPQPVPEALSTELGADRAARRVHPTESLRAANTLFGVVLEEVVDDAGPQLPAPTVAKLATRLNEAIFQRLDEGAVAYAGFLLNEVHQANHHERHRVARELHDRVTMGLTAAHRQLELAEIRGETDPARARVHVSSALGAIIQSQDTIRKLAMGLRLDPAGQSIGETLGTCLGAFDSTTVAIGIQVNGDEIWLPPPIRDEVTLILREAVRNALVHANANMLSVVVDVLPYELRACVQDNGDGFDQDRGTPGTGLASMAERAALLAGTLRVRSAPRRGTVVELLVPLRRPAPSGGGDGADE